MIRLDIKKDKLNDDSIHRYPIYLKTCRKLQRDGYSMTVSTDLEKFTHIDSRTIRKDLSKLGKLGIKSKGYRIDVLIKALSKVLGTDTEEEIILVGVGEIGNALLNYNNWSNITGKIVCAFDEKPKRIKNSNNVKVYSLKQLKEKKPETCKIAILCTSKNTQKIVDELIDCGIKGIVNFTLQHIEAPANIIVNDVDLLSNIQEILMKLNIKEEKK